MISKDILIQYKDLTEEIESVRKRIGILETEISKMEESGYREIDSVKGGSGGTKHFKIEGFPYERYSKKRTLLFQRKSILETLEFDLLEMTNEVEAFIASVEDSKMRRILTMRYIDNLSFEEIGEKTNYYRTSISRIIDKFLET